MKIGILGDSHDHADHLRKAIDILKERGVDFVVHCGDYVSPGNVLLFEGLQLIGIFGNDDGDIFALTEAFREIGGDLKGYFGEFFAGEKKFAIYHGDHEGILDALIRCGKYDVVIHGHTHKKGDFVVGATRAICPGTVHGFGAEATIAIYEIEDNKLEFIEL